MLHLPAETGAVSRGTTCEAPLAHGSPASCPFASDALHPRCPFPQDRKKTTLSLYNPACYVLGLLVFSRLDSRIIARPACIHPTLTCFVLSFPPSLLAA